MKAKTMLLLLVALTTTRALAQDYPQVDEAGQTIYYKIISACPEYEAQRLCIQDDSQSRTDYPYVLLEHDAEQRRQEWTLLAASTADRTYHLRNRMSYRYVSTAGTWVNDVYVHSYAILKAESDALTLTPISDGQVTISYNVNGEERLLAARKVGAPLPAQGSSLVDSPWAWRIVPTTDLTGIQTVQISESTVHRIYDLQGRRMESATLPRGVYIVDGKKRIK